MLSVGRPVSPPLNPTCPVSCARRPTPPDAAAVVWVGREGHRGQRRQQRLATDGRLSQRSNACPRTVTPTAAATAASSTALGCRDVSKVDHKELQAPTHATARCATGDGSGRHRRGNPRRRRLDVDGRLPAVAAATTCSVIDKREGIRHAHNAAHRDMAVITNSNSRSASAGGSGGAGRHALHTAQSMQPPRSSTLLLPLTPGASPSAAVATRSIATTPPSTPSSPSKGRGPAATPPPPAAPPAPPRGPTVPPAASSAPRR